jgi:hypothetical protein
MKRHLAPLAFGISLLAAGSALAQSITFYEGDNYRGRQFTADQPLTNFARTGHNDRARSAVVRDGSWEICMDADFRGSCSVLAPGSYPDLGEYAGRISSARLVDGARAQNRPGDHGRNRDSREARATLYEGQNLSGRSFPIDGTVRNLSTTGFNDRASSVRIESGYWIFCSDAEFRGECRTFGPGEYANLPGLNDVISSGRRISNEYPYAEKPNWQREPLRQSQNFQR